MPTNFVIGQVIMLLCCPEIQKQKGKWVTFPLLCLLAYSLFIFVPVTAWAFFRHTAWSTVYLRPENSIPGWGGPAFFAQYFSGMLFGGLLAQTLIQLGRTKMVFITLLFGILWLAGIWGFTFDQYTHIGSFGEYRWGQAVSIYESSEFQKHMNIMGALLFLPLITMAVLLFKRSRRLSRRWFRPTKY